MADWHKLRGTESGRTFILGNGPSLLDHDLKRIRVSTIGINKSYLVRHSYYHVCADLSTFEPEEDKILQELEWVFSVKGRAGLKKYAVLLNDLGPDIAYSPELERGVFPRFSTYIAIQLAHWLGFDEVVLLGVDLCERDGQGHFYRGKPMARIVEHQMKCFRVLKKLQKLFPIPRIVVCSEISKLDMFPKVCFEDVV